MEKVVAVVVLGIVVLLCVVRLAADPHVTQAAQAAQNGFVQSQLRIAVATQGH